MSASAPATGPGRSAELLEELHALAAGHKREELIEHGAQLGRLLEPVVREMALVPEVAYEIRLSTQVNGIRLDLTVQAPQERPRRTGVTFPYEVARRPPQ